MQPDPNERAEMIAFDKEFGKFQNWADQDLVVGEIIPSQLSNYFAGPKSRMLPAIKDDLLLGMVREEDLTDLQKRIKLDVPELFRIFDYLNDPSFWNRLVEEYNKERPEDTKELISSLGEVSMKGLAGSIWFNNRKFFNAALTFIPLAALYGNTVNGVLTTDKSQLPSYGGKLANSLSSYAAGLEMGNLFEGEAKDFDTVITRLRSLFEIDTESNTTLIYRLLEKNGAFKRCPARKITNAILNQMSHLLAEEGNIQAIQARL